MTFDLAVGCLPPVSCLSCAVAECDASVAPPGGTVGNCPSMLPADQTCSPACGPHAHLEGVTSCDGSNAKLTPAQCACDAGATGSPSEGCTPCPVGTFTAGAIKCGVM